MRVPTYLDRYPAKMVSKLADRLVDEFASRGTSVLDPFCGSGAVLRAAHNRGLRVTGVDLNPLAELYCSVKLDSFDVSTSTMLARRWIDAAKSESLQHAPERKDLSYWFTPATLRKLEALRLRGQRLELRRDKEGKALLLAFVLAVRLCSRADQRSPKPFISKTAKVTRGGKHFDPFIIVPQLLYELAITYGGKQQNGRWTFLNRDIRHPNAAGLLAGHSHVITSPPYINAQDYYRNFKLELALTEGLLSFSVSHIKCRFIGTERGDLLGEIEREELARNRELVPVLRQLESSKPRLASIVHRYFVDMERALRFSVEGLKPNGTLVLVCGDNLVGGIRIVTWRVLQKLLESMGLQLRRRFRDQIGDRLLAPRRMGHKGIIKTEVVSEYVRDGDGVGDCARLQPGSSH